MPPKVRLHQLFRKDQTHPGVWCYEEAGKGKAYDIKKSRGHFLPMEGTPALSWVLEGRAETAPVRRCSGACSERVLLCRGAFVLTKPVESGTQEPVRGWGNCAGHS